MVANGTQTSTYYDIGLDEPYLLASSAGSSLVPGFFQVSIGGHAYATETSFEPYRRDAFRSDSIEPIADKLDLNNIPGEGSVNTDGLWRRGAIDWSMGSGQQYFDRDQSKPSRFYTSKGVYPWQEWQATLLNDTIRVHSSGSELQVIVVGQYVYINDGGTVRYSSGNLTTWHALSGVTAALTSSALATDGNNLYIAAGSNGIYLVVTGTSPSVNNQWITGTVDYVWYVGGQLLCAATNNLYVVTTPTSTAGPTALATPLLATANAKFVWSAACAGNSWIYVGGGVTNTGANSSLIYKTQINSAGTVMTVPVVAATLPGGELLYSLFAYSNFILVGTSLGARFCETLGINDPGGNAGDLKMGPIIPDLIQQVSQPVQAFTGQARFIWFGWADYDTVSTGLGRMDLSTFIDQQAPAYTSDLMVTGTGQITSMDWYNGLNNVAGVLTGSPIFVVNGLGVYSAAATYVTSGTIDSGQFGYGIPDDKIGRFFDFGANGTAGSISATITPNNQSGVMVNSQNLSSALSQVSLPNPRGELFDVLITMTSGDAPQDYDSGNAWNSAFAYDSGYPTASPTLYRWTMKALPAVVSGTIHKCIINLFGTVQGTQYSVSTATDAYTEFAFLDGLRQSQTPVIYQEGTEFSVEVVITNVTRLVYNERGGPEGGFNQRLELWLKTLEN